MPWPEPFIEKFIHEAEPEVAWVIMTSVYLGQRIGDTLKMDWGHLNGNKIEVVQDKSGKHLVIPLHPDLKDLFNIIPKRSTRILTTKTGIVWTYSNWSETFIAERKRLINTQDFVTHGLRKNAVIRLLKAGCTVKQVGSITGQSDDIVMYYARQMEQEELAEIGMEKYAAWSANQ